MDVTAFWLLMAVLIAIAAAALLLLLRRPRGSAKPLVILVPLAGLVIVGTYIVWVFATQAN